jgi:hypothetical protein
LQEFDDAVKQLEMLSVVEPTSSDRLKLGNHRKLQILLINLLQPFLEGYLTVCQLLQQVCWTPESFSSGERSENPNALVTAHEAVTSHINKIKLSLCLTKHHAMKIYWRAPAFLTSALDGSE